MTGLVAPRIPSIRSRLIGAVVSFLLGFGIANYGVIVVPRPDLWIWLAVAIALMGTGVAGVLFADARTEVSVWVAVGVQLFAVFTLVPLLWVFSVATAPGDTPRRTLWPSDVSWAAFGDVRSTDALVGAAGTTALVAGLATVVALLLAVPAAFGFVQRPLRGRRVAWGVFAAALVLPSAVLAAPASAQLLAWGATQSRVVMVLPTLAVSLPIAVWLAAQALRHAPWTLDDALRADGATVVQRVRRFVLPYLGLDLLLVAVLVFFWTAGDLALGAGMASTADTRPLPASLLLLSGRGEVSSQVVAAAGLLWLLPIALVLLVFSRRIVALLGRP